MIAYPTERPLDNLRSIGAGRAAEPREISATAWHDAEETALANVESFTDWLAGECMHQTDVRIGYVPRDAAALQERIDGMAVAQLVALQLYPRAEASFAATQELQRRYLARPATQTLLMRVASEA